MSTRLPILERRAEIEEAIRAHQVVIVCGETGSGKTTQLPQICFEMGLADRAVIAHTQPRRLAARAVAARIAEERGERLGETVGVKVRFQDQTSGATRIKLMTDGMLLAELSGDPGLSAYSTVIIDEAHERSLNVDFLLGYLMTTLPRRPELKVIVTSATIDPGRFSDFFGGARSAPVLEVSGRTYPVDVRYRPTDADEDDFERLEISAVTDAVTEFAVGPAGDVLVFLPGEREIRLAADDLRRSGIDAEVLPLFARLTSQEQDRIFHTGDRRRVILATNIAETSLTVPGIRYVVDTGLARISRYDPSRKVQRLPIEPISRASANQRAGRCGRVAAGVCIRLYSEDSYHLRPAFTDPEIRRTSLAGAVLRMKSLGLPDIEDFPLLDPPDSGAVRDGYETLFELGAIDEPSRKGRITEIGRAMSRVPTDPRIARMLLGAERETAIPEIIVLAAVLSIQDPRQRPASRQEEADRAQAVFRHESSDFLTLLNLWDQYTHAAGSMPHGALQGWCREHFLSSARMREWGEMIRQLAAIAEELELTRSTTPATPDAIHRSLLTGLISNVACREGDSASFAYRGVRGNAVSLFPGSVLFKKGPKWIMAAEMVQTTKLFARTLARIEPEWIEELAGHMFRHQLSDRHLDADSGEPSAWERVTMNGIVVVPRRRASIARLDPAAAREVFIREGLAMMKWRTDLSFMAHNRAAVESARALEAKLRRRNLIRSERELAERFEELIPAGVCDPATLDVWLRSTGDPEGDSLRLSPDQVLRPDAVGGADPALFPDSLSIGGVECPLHYALAPGKDEDGVTIDVPLLTLDHLGPERVPWLVPGMLPDVISALIKGLPRQERTAIEQKASPESVGQACAQVMNSASGRLPDSLSETVDVLFGVRVSPDVWKLNAIPDHLRPRVRVIDDAGRELAIDRDIAALHARLSGRVARARAGAARSRFERHGITTWDFDTLPEHVEIDREGKTVEAFPALMDGGKAVSLTLCASPRLAAAHSLLGLRRLFALASRDEVAHYLASLPAWHEASRQYAAVGDAGSLDDDTACVVAERVFLWNQAPVRTRAEFEARSREMWGRLAVAAREVGESIGRVLEARQKVAQRFSGGTPRLWADSVADMREHAAFLMPRGFVRRLSWEHLRSYPKYAEALRERLFALREDGSGVEKESLRALLPRWKNFTSWVAAAMNRERVLQRESGEGVPAPTPASSKAPLPQARRAAPTVNVDAGEWASRPGALPPEVERYRWALEDWRAVLFGSGKPAAPDLNTRQLDALWKKIADTTS